MAHMGRRMPRGWNSARAATITLGPSPALTLSALLFIAQSPHTPVQARRPGYSHGSQAVVALWVTNASQQGEFGYGKESSGQQG